MKCTEINRAQMQPTVVKEHHKRPVAAAYMMAAMLPKMGFRTGIKFPRIVERWNGIRIDRVHLQSFLEMTGLPSAEGITKLGSGPGVVAALLYPHVFGFPLFMSLVTNRVFPLSLWRALQIRNHFLLHRPYSEHEALDLAIGVGEQRTLAKGVEVDLHGTLSARGERVWEGLTTFYYRGNHGQEQTPSPLAKPLQGAWSEVSRWSMPSQRGIGWRFAELTGDYNGIHWQNWYARLMGFKTALYHPQLVVGQSLSRLAPPDGSAMRLDVWLKGPVYHRSNVRLTASDDRNRRWFSLSMEGKSRPSIVGRWSAADPGARLVDDRDVPLPLGTDEDGAL